MARALLTQTTSAPAMTTELTRTRGRGRSRASTSKGGGNSSTRRLSQGRPGAPRGPRRLNRRACTSTDRWTPAAAAATSQ